MVGIEVAAVVAGHPAKQAVVADAAKPEVVAAAAATADTARIAEEHRWKTAAEVAGIVPAAVPLRPNAAVVVVPSSWRRLTAPEKSARA